MKLTVDASKCQGHGRCYAIAPDLFDLDQDGNGLARPGDVPEGRRQDAELAAANCPEMAITISEG